MGHCTGLTCYRAESPLCFSTNRILTKQEPFQLPSYMHAGVPRNLPYGSTGNLVPQPALCAGEQRIMCPSACLCFIEWRALLTVVQMSGTGEPRLNLLVSQELFRPPSLPCTGDPEPFLVTSLSLVPWGSSGRQPAYIPWFCLSFRHPPAHVLESKGPSAASLSMCCEMKNLFGPGGSSHLPILNLPAILVLRGPLQPAHVPRSQGSGSPQGTGLPICYGI